MDDRRILELEKLLLTTRLFMNFRDKPPLTKETGLKITKKEDKKMTKEEIKLMEPVTMPKGLFSNVVHQSLLYRDLRKLNDKIASLQYELKITKKEDKKITKEEYFDFENYKYSFQVKLENNK